MTYRSNHHIGRTREKLAALLEAQGFTVHPEDLHAAKGAWRTRVQLDTERWYGKGVAHNHPTIRDGWEVHFSSWFTMTVLCKAGRVEAKQDDRAPYGHLDVTTWSEAEILRADADVPEKYSWP